MKTALYYAGLWLHITPLSMKVCICHFVKCQIHTFIATEPLYIHVKPRSLNNAHILCYFRHKLNSYSNVDDFDRRFYIWKNYGGCNNDKGWFMVADLLHGPGRCSWERRNIYARDLPFFLYNNYPTARHPSGNVTYNDTRSLATRGHLCHSTA